MEAYKRIIIKFVSLGVARSLCKFFRRACYHYYKIHCKKLWKLVFFCKARKAVFP